MGVKLYIHIDFDFLVCEVRTASPAFLTRLRGNPSCQRTVKRVIKIPGLVKPLHSSCGLLLAEPKGLIPRILATSSRKILWRASFGAS